MLHFLNKMHWPSHRIKVGPSHCWVPALSSHLVSYFLNKPYRGSSHRYWQEEQRREDCVAPWRHDVSQWAHEVVESKCWTQERIWSTAAPSHRSARETCRACSTPSWRSAFLLSNLHGLSRRKLSNCYNIILFTVGVHWHLTFIVQNWSQRSLRRSMKLAIRQIKML